MAPKNYGNYTSYGKALVNAGQLARRYSSYEYGSGRRNIAMPFQYPSSIGRPGTAYAPPGRVRPIGPSGFNKRPRANQKNQTTPSRKVISRQPGKTGKIVIAKKKKQNTSYNKNGSVLRYENGGQVTDPECVYVGHSVATYKVVTSVLRAVIKELFRQRGTDIIDWDDTVQNATSLTLEYSYNTNQAVAGALTTRSIAATGLTYQGLALAWQSDIDTAWSAQPHSIEEVTLYLTVDKGGVANAAVIPSAKVHGKNFNIDFSFDSKLKIQNVTSSSTVGVDEDQLANAINNNPLIGNLYSHNKNQLNGFEPAKNEDSGTTFIADNQTGIISSGASTNSLSQYLKKPPPAWAFKAKRVKKLTLEPGQIRYAHMTYKASMSLQTFLTKLHYTISDGSSDYAVNFCFAQMFGLEKMLDDRSETNDIVLSYEVVQTYACKGYNRRFASVPIVELT